MNRGGSICTQSGIQFFPLDPRPEEIRIEDIAYALSNQCRFSGHCRPAYSVGEHSWRLSRIVPPEDALWGLLHDASEAYLVDVPRPIKADLGRYKEFEARVMLAVCQRFGLPIEEPSSVRIADQRMLVTEQRDLMPVTSWWRESADGVPLPDRITPFHPATVESLFLTRFDELGGRR